MMQANNKLFYTEKKLTNKSNIIKLQSNLCSKASLGTQKSGWFLKVAVIQRLGLIKINIKIGRCTQAAVVQRWFLTQV
jgi:hypothetical protein